jgi:hypothetical protein
MSDASLPVFDFEQMLPLRFHFPTRMTVLPLGSRQVALVSPIPIDEGMAQRIAELGEVQWLIAPNLLHHLYLADALERYPGARVLAPPRLGAKRPDLRIAATLDGPVPEELAAAVDVLRIEGAPSIDEFVFFHWASRSLVVTDLVFHVLQPRGFLAHLFLWLGGCHRRLGASRVWRLQVKDRAALRSSLERVLALPFERLVMAHGEIIQDAARSRLEEALRGLRSANPNSSR